MSTLTAKQTRIFLSPPHMEGSELDFVHEAYDGNWIAPVGPNLDAFEHEFCACFGFRHAVALSSGTAALHLAMLHLGLKPGDDVACSTLTFAASANPIVYTGAKPVFIDSDEETWNLDPNLFEQWIKKRAQIGELPRALVVVDLYGQCADLVSISRICADYEVFLIEDAAEALGATCAGIPAGRFGGAAAFSFNGNKIITTSGGGMLVSDDGELIARAKFLATQARDPAAHYQHSSIGYNYRLSNILAGIGRGQLKAIYQRVQARRDIFARYHEGLADLPGLQFMPEAPYSRSNRWLTCITIDPHLSQVNREQVRVALEAENIESRPVWKPLHLQPVFANCEVVGGAVAERLFDRGLCLPSGSALSEDDLDRVIGVVRKVFLGD